MISTLIDALKLEFEDDVVFSSALPGTVVPPAVIVAPGDPFLTPATHGTVEERWDVLVAVSIKEPAVGIDQMRDLSLRVRRTVVRNGAVWRRASGPRRFNLENSQTVVSLNEVVFKYGDTD
jgi:hypothetical protein